MGSINYSVYGSPASLLALSPAPRSTRQPWSHLASLSLSRLSTGIWRSPPTLRQPRSRFWSLTDDCQQAFEKTFVPSSASISLLKSSIASISLRRSAWHTDYFPVASLALASKTCQMIVNRHLTRTVVPSVASISLLCSTRLLPTGIWHRPSASLSLLTSDRRQATGISHRPSSFHQPRSHFSLPPDIQTTARRQPRSEFSSLPDSCQQKFWYVLHLGTYLPQLPQRKLTQLSTEILIRSTP